MSEHVLRHLVSRGHFIHQYLIQIEDESFYPIFLDSSFVSELKTERQFGNEILAIVIFIVSNY
jgi:hypothetical protein